MVLRHHSLWSVKMFLDLWNFWCLILASKVLLAFTVQWLHLPTRAATLRVNLLPKCSANFIQCQTCTSRSEDQILGPGQMLSAQMHCTTVQPCLLCVFVLCLYWAQLHSILLPWRNECILPPSQSSQCLSVKALWERWFRLCTSWWWHKSCVSCFGFFYNPFYIGF